MTFVNLESERLIYRKFHDSDVPDVYQWLGHDGNMRLMRMNPCNEAETKAFVQNAGEQADKSVCTEYNFAAVLKETGGVIGVAILMDFGIQSEIGWILHRDYWNRGYGTELGQMLLDFGFGKRQLHRIVAHCDAENPGSYRVMEKIGMRREGYFVKGRLGNSVLGHALRNELSYAILREEWERGRQA